MIVFISCSGAMSYSLAETLRQWLPSVIEAMRPFMSAEDISKGARWRDEISRELERARIGILVMTPENLLSPWLLFEAGALSKVVVGSKICPVLFGVKADALPEPLRQFQTTTLKKEDFWRLIQIMNGELEGNRILPKTLRTVFDLFWPRLDAQISAILTAQADAGLGALPKSGNGDAQKPNEGAAVTRAPHPSH